MGASEIELYYMGASKSEFAANVAPAENGRITLSAYLKTEADIFTRHS